MLKKAVMVVTGNALGFLLSLIRNLVVARLISPENYGIASSFAVSMSIVEMLSYLGLNQLMVVDKDGDDPHFQAAMQGFQVLRGCFSSLMLYLIARPYAAYLHIEQVTWAFQILAFVPLVNGLQHYDPHRLRRHLNFTPMILSNALPPLVAVLVLWPLALIYHDYKIMLASIFVQAGAMVLVSHVTAERRYRLALDAALMKRATQFGWPILLNGMLMFGVFNGERLIVGRELGMDRFAYFSMAFTLTLTPTLVLASSCQSLFLPQLTRLKDKAAEFQRMADVTLESSLGIGLALVLGTSLIGGPLVHLLTGPKYISILSFLVPMAVMQAVRVAKTGSALVALAVGKSGNAMIGNSVRVASLPISWWVAVRTGDILAIIWVATVAEVLGYVLAMVLAARRAGVSLAALNLPTALATLTCGLALADALWTPPQPGLGAHLHWGLLAVAVAGLASFATMTGLRHYLLVWWRARRGA
ncbi:MAG: oligosaccharide flippase family protein [Proteobacteria bacterium]|nr:oligosaccharide flippase family protein [Pseudomonadota bacterium]